jgi:hypothetical protein
LAGVTSTNKLRNYDKAVAGLISAANADLEKYNSFFGNVQEIVVKAFKIGNAFAVGPKIVADIETRYKKAQDDWNNIRPNINSLIVDLRANINKKNEDLGKEHLNIQENSQLSYNTVVEAIEECIEYNDSGVFFKTFKTRYFDEDRFIPKFL